MKFIRSFFAVLAGYILLIASLFMFDVMANIIDPTAARPSVVILLASSLFKLLASAVSGFVTASLAGHKRLSHAGVLAVVSIIVALIQFDQTGLVIPIWAQVLGILAVFAGVLFGGWLRLAYGRYVYSGRAKD